MYVNDLCHCSFSRNSSLVLYADDTTLFKPVSAPSDLAELQSDIDIIHTWFSNNHLTANSSKTKVMIISTKHNPVPNLNLTLNGQPIERVSTAKFLGVCLTNMLSWNIHVDTICKKARTIIGFIHRSSASSSTLLVSVRHLDMVVSLGIH